MKKLITTAFLLGTILSLSAQQLPDNGFEKAWVDCYPWTSNTNNTSKSTSQGTTPPDWTVSNTIGTGSLGKTTVAERVDGKSGKAVKVFNVSAVMKQVIPGYFTLGTPWSTAVLTNQKDGGTWGGISFTYRPDALRFDYISTGSGNVLPTVVAYAWKGEYSQADVPANIVMSGSPQKVTMKNRDRNILGIQTAKGGNVTQSGTRICKINDKSTLTRAQSSFASVTLPFEYESTETPEMINVIFAAGDYFSDTPTADLSLTVDNVTLLYYSRLKSLSVNGTEVENFSSDTYEYAMTVDALPTADQIEASCLGNSGSASAQVTVDEATKTATIVVTNSNAGGTDIDGQTTHTYTITFTVNEKKEWGGDIYNGTVTIKAYPDLSLDEDLDVPNSKVHIIDNGDGTYTFALPNFTLDGTEAGKVGEIVIENVSMTEADGVKTYSGQKEGLKIMNGNVTANVTVNGTVDASGKAVMHITVNIDGTNTPMYVEFNGQAESGTKWGGTVYDGKVGIQLEDGDPSYVDGSVHIIDNGNGTCTFVLPNFSLDGTEAGLIGDIVVENVSMTPGAGKTTYSGTVEGLKLLDGAIVANVEITGFTDDEGNCEMKIEVIWLGDDGNGGINEVPIHVTFNGKRNAAGIDGIESDPSVYPVEYYNIQGMRVNPENLTPGIYIRRQGKDVKKILLK